MQLRGRSFQLALSDQRVQGALMAAKPWAVPNLDTCRCCCYPTVTHGYYDVCWICRWFDDVTGDFDPDDPHATTNHGYSLNEARRNFIDACTMFPPSDHRYAEEAKRAAERARLVEVYDALLPDVRPGAFIAVLPRLEALHAAYDERRYGKRDRPVLPYPAEPAERHRVNREREIRRAFRRRSLPLFADLHGPPTLRRQHATFTAMAGWMAPHEMARRIATYLDDVSEYHDPRILRRSQRRPEMQLIPEELTTLRPRRRSFHLALADQRVQGALIASTPGRMPHLGTCPCCGYPTISRELYDICAVCDWQDDGQDDSTAGEITGGPNDDYSLAQARKNFRARRTMYRATDPRHDKGMKAVEERERLTDSYDSLLPDVDPWAFIGILPRVNALKRALDEKRFGAERVVRRCADETHESRQADRDWEIWRAIAHAPLPKQAGAMSQPSVDLRSYRLFQALVSDVTDRIETLLEAAAPTVAHRGLWYRCWSAGARSAWVRAFHRRWGVEFEPSASGKLDGVFWTHDDDAPERIAQSIAAYFGGSSHMRT